MTIGQRVQDRMAGGYGRVAYVDETTIMVRWDAGVTMSYMASTRSLRPVGEPS
jgi:hypothetical protein